MKPVQCARLVAAPITIFAFTYLLIALTRVPNTVAALLGATAMVFAGALDSGQAFRHVDLDVIMLLAGMMIFAHVLGRTGVFDWSAVYGARIVRANGFGILALLCCISALASALLDNVTTIVMLLPVTFSLCRSLDLDPLPFVLGEVFASNIGGAATLIGDPPNIIIGSAGDIDFVSFVANLAPIIVLCLVFLLGLLYLWFHGRVRIPESKRIQLMGERKGGLIRDRELLVKSLIVGTLTLAGFLVHGLFDISPAFIALGAAAILLLISGVEPEEALRQVQWSTLFFFVGLFIVVGGLVENGVLSKLEDWLVRTADGDLNLLAVTLLWFSGVTSSLVDNIPYAATMTPVVREIAVESGRSGISPLWWALSLGANLGGNMTLVGASANVLAADFTRKSGDPITFLQFLKHGAVLSLGTLGLATAYVWVRYLA